GVDVVTLIPIERNGSNTDVRTNAQNAIAVRKRGLIVMRFIDVTCAGHRAPAIEYRLKNPEPRALSEIVATRPRAILAVHHSNQPAWEKTVEPLDLDRVGKKAPGEGQRISSLQVGIRGRMDPSLGFIVIILRRHGLGILLLKCLNDGGVGTFGPAQTGRSRKKECGRTIGSSSLVARFRAEDFLRIGE